MKRGYIVHEALLKSFWAILNSFSTYPIPTFILSTDIWYSVWQCGPDILGNNSSHPELECVVGLTMAWLMILDWKLMNEEQNTGATSLFAALFCWHTHCIKNNNKFAYSCSYTSILCSVSMFLCHSYSVRCFTVLSIIGSWFTNDLFLTIRTKWKPSKWKQSVRSICFNFARSGWLQATPKPGY